MTTQVMKNKFQQQTWIVKQIRDPKVYQTIDARGRFKEQLYTNEEWGQVKKKFPI